MANDPVSTLPQISPTHWPWLLALGLGFAASPTWLQAAEPYRPARDDQVLQTLPREFLSSRDEVATLRGRLAEDPRDSRIASEVAQRYLALGQQLADPRYYGYAQAAIAPWWEQDAPPAEILRVRAKLKERDHRYTEAVADLQQLVLADPKNAQAWIELANIYRVLGEYDRSRQACDELAKFASTETVQICEIPWLAATGNAEAAYQKLEDLLPTVRRQFPAALQWVYATQAEIARALGRDQQAEAHFREGIARDPDNYYLLRGYADLLLDQQRASEALTLLEDHLADTGILLRAGIAARRAKQPEKAETYKDQLRQRFVETRLRGGQPHGRYESRYYLELEDDPQKALAVAKENWERQKETRDTRNLLEAALAADDPSAAEPAVKFLKRYQVDDRILRDLLRQLEQR